MPGTFVAIGWNGPRTESVASGFGSHRSRWLGPPQLKIMITDLALPSRRGAAIARARPAQYATHAPAAALRTDRRDDKPSPMASIGRNSFGSFGNVNLMATVKPHRFADAFAAAMRQ